jgi:glycosyltransferase involved in cell wall biosynthesis
VRLAFASPLPPSASGIADYAADVLALLAPRHEVELFHAQETVDAARLPAGLPLYPAAGFLERHRRRPFDLAVYQMGNGRGHDFLYELVSRVPGLLVLHDLVLHHARAAQFLEAEPVRAWRANPASVAARQRAQPVLAAWRAELEYAYPRAGARLFAVQLGTVGELLPYAYPLFRIPVEASRLVAVHNRFMADAIREEVPDARVACAPMPVVRVPLEARAVRELRARLGFDDGHLVVGVFGLLTPEKRPLSVARAVARVASAHDGLRLLLVGPVPDQARLESDLERLGVRGRTVFTGRVPLAELAVHIEAADVVAHLRYPTARETSAALLRVLAQGRPTIVSDLEQQADLPRDTVLRVDPADEQATLTDALGRLAGDAALRRGLAEAAAAFVSREHAPDRVTAAWEDVLEQARSRPAPAPRNWPAHWARPTPEAGAEAR